VQPLAHAAILLTLAHYPQGRSASRLARDLLGDHTRTVTVRAEVSRLRRTLGPLFEHLPPIGGSAPGMLRVVIERAARLLDRQQRVMLTEVVGDRYIREDLSHQLCIGP